MIMTVTGIQRPAAMKLLDESGGHVKTALVMHFRGVDRATAQSLLAAHKGHVAPILESKQARDGA
jgi:N-acetylmuramic acid 6-phosphate etherase